MLQDNTSTVALLIVDDEPDITDELSEFFLLHGFDCFSTNNSQEAIALFHQHPSIGIILTDLHMPVLNGIELIAQLKKEQPLDRSFEAILFTARSEKDDIIRALRTGFTDFYPKPLDFNNVLTAVKQLHKKQLQFLTSNSSKKIDTNISQLTDHLQTLQSLLETYSQVEGNKDTQQPQKAPIAAGSPLDKLTRRQKEVALLAADGLTNLQIASTLNIQENTVKLYISQILKATGVANRTQLALLIYNQAQQH
ncbi:response regulator transcription factor [Denitrificimonas sp. JX-1]|uniref:Response regulator transcription factor n=1 Tax=Denitrificimonas halotolerans TaxID=3098930 RepID=A0ABU5GRB0_9GAMM|nr:response regulator transcription factor [Denitrificimonas sp. JX-1]MDY7219528.1 response regulator transcription factor [Denitrificimonas sp. JX-1]